MASKLRPDLTQSGVFDVTVLTEEAQKLLEYIADLQDFATNHSDEDLPEMPYVASWLYERLINGVNHTRECPEIPFDEVGFNFIPKAEI